MNTLGHNIETRKQLLPTRIASSALIILVLSLIPLFGCSPSNSYTISDVDCYDFNGNLLTGCEEEVIDRGSSASVVVTYHGYNVYALELNVGYEDWVNSIRSDNVIDYGYYYVYTADGERYALFYFNNSNTCWEIPVADSHGRSDGSVFINRDGDIVTINTVTGEGNGAFDSALTVDSLEQSSEVFQSLDPDYLTRI